MTPGPMEELSKVPAEIVGSLKTQPTMLALLVLNVVFLGFLAWMSNEVGKVRQFERTQLQASLDKCLQVPHP